MAERLRYNGYCVNTWAFPKSAESDLLLFSIGKINLLALLRKYDGSEGQSFKTFNFLEGVPSRDMILENDDIALYFDDTYIILVEKLVPSDFEFWLSCDKQ